VKAVVDSGLTVPKLIAQLKNRMPTGEIFRRIRPKKLIDLLHLHAYELEAKHSAAAPDSAHHHTHSGLVFDDGPAAAPPAAPGECPFLLLDVRDEDDFAKCHIQNAQCYPKGRLSRATGQFSQEILSFRGQPKKVIVLYCDYGATSADAAQQFAEREFDNVFLLHGGLADFAVEFPDFVGPGDPPKPEAKLKAKPLKPQNAFPLPAKKGTTRAAQASAAPAGARKVWK
jgi:centrosomal protein CEP41